MKRKHNRQSKLVSVVKLKLEKLPLYFFTHTLCNAKMVLPIIIRKSPLLKFKDIKFNKLPLDNKTQTPSKERTAPIILNFVIFVFNIIADNQIVIIGLRLTIRAAFTGEVYCIPKKKNILKPKSPMIPTNKIPLTGTLSISIFRSDLLESRINGSTPKIYLQEADSITCASCNMNAAK